jgi:hypothetical protein
MFLPYEGSLLVWSVLVLLFRSRVSLKADVSCSQFPRIWPAGLPPSTPSELFRTHAVQHVPELADKDDLLS